MQVEGTGKWKTLPYQQVSEDSLWEITRNYNCYLVKNHRMTFSKDPLNLTGLNTKRDSGIAATHALGIGYEQTERKVREKKAKKKAKVIRFAFRVKTKKQLSKKKLIALPEKKLPTTNNTVYTDNRRITARAIVKALQRNLSGYRKDLLPLAFRRLRKLNKFKRANKRTNKAEAKKVKA
jgi:hypothetical protein